MNEEATTETETGADHTDTLTMAPAVVPVERLIALIIDAPRCKARLAELDRKIRAAVDAEAKLAAARLEFEQSATARATELARREQAVDERENAAFAADAALKEREEKLRDHVLALRDEDNIYKRRVMAAVGITRHETMQDLPMWRELAIETLGRQEVEALENPGGEPDASMPDDPGFELQPPAGSTLTRSRPLRATPRPRRRGGADNASAPA